jgi:hypothetical protein
MSGINQSLTPVGFTRYGPRRCSCTHTIPSPHRLFALSHIFFVSRDFYPVPISSSPTHPCSPVYSRGAPLESVVSLPLSSRSVKLVEDFLPMILVVYTFHRAHILPSFVSPSSPPFSQECVCTINVIFTALSWKVIEAYSASASCPTDAFHDESVTQFPIGVGGSTSLPPPLTTSTHPKCLKLRTGRQRLPAPKLLFVFLLTSSNSRLFLTTDSNSSRRGNKPPSRTRVPHHRGRSPRYRKTPLLRIHPRPKPMKPRTRQTCKSHPFRNSATGGVVLTLNSCT